MPLTAARAQAAVTFGGGYRLVDFVLSSFVNSGIRSVYVLTQFNNGPLLRHLQEVWRLTNAMNNGQQFISALPGWLHRGERWYLGTANAVYQNLGLLQQADPEAVAIFGADHVYRMDVRQMLAHHRANRSAAIVAAMTAAQEARETEAKFFTGLDGGLHEPLQPCLHQQGGGSSSGKGLYSGEVTGVLDEATMTALGDFRKRTASR